jgi:TIR domain/WD domain, G-beta repeat
MPVKIFCCYARKDQSLLLKLITHLTSLEHEGLITLWADVNINAGMEWEKEIDRHLYTARIILLLISPDFMASEYCYSHEMQGAMERHERGEAHVIPIILRPVSWQKAPFGKLQALPTNASPITSGKWHHQDDAFFNVAEGVRKEVEAILAKEGQTEEEGDRRTEEAEWHQAEEQAHSVEEKRVRKAKEEVYTRLPEEKQRSQAEEAKQARLAEKKGEQGEQASIDRDVPRPPEATTRQPPPQSSINPPFSLRKLSRRKVITGLIVIGVGGTTWWGLSHWAVNPAVISPPNPTPLPTETPFYTYHGHSSLVEAVAWQPHGKRIASGGDDKTVQVWDAVDGGHVFTYRGHTNTSSTGWVDAVAWSPDGKRIASGGGTVDNNYLDHTVQVWIAADGGNVFTYRGHSNSVAAVAWSPDGKRIASGSWDVTVQVWSVG